MRAHVFTDAALAKHAGRFVWLSIDTEQERNAGFVARFPIENWPTLMVVDPTTEQPVFKWPGSATVQQLERLFSDAEAAFRRAGGEGFEEELAAADRLNAERRYLEAAEAYRRLLESAPPDFDRRPRAVESLILALYQGKQKDGCAEAAAAEVGKLPRGPSFANAAAVGLFCAMSAEGAGAKAALQRLRPFAEEALRLPGILADDRSGLFSALVELREEEGDEQGKQRLAGKWLLFLEAEAAAAETPEARAAFDPHRVLAAQELGDPARAVPALQQSERELPRDYNAPARLALLLRQLGRFDEAIAAHDRALARAYGPRTLLLYEQKAQTYMKAGDRAKALATYEEARRAARAMPPSPLIERGLRRIDKAATELQGEGG